MVGSGNPRGSADRPPERLNLPVLPGPERHRSQLLAVCMSTIAAEAADSLISSQSDSNPPQVAA